MSREVAWESATPSLLHGVATAHIERPCLEWALWRRASQSRRLELSVGVRPVVEWDGTHWRGDGWTAEYLVDATGRRAVTAISRTKPSQPWVARMWSFPASAAGVSGSVALAALPGGYVYRLASCQLLLVGLVGPAYGAVKDFGVLERILSSSEAAWIVRGLSPSVARRERARVASVQWSSTDARPAARVLRIGDAALARDALSSQGLATSLSETVYAAAALLPGGAGALLALRQDEQRSVHIQSLCSFLDRCRWRSSSAWSAYHDWLRRHESGTNRVVALRDGILCEVPPTAGPRAPSKNAFPGSSDWRVGVLRI